MTVTWVNGELLPDDRATVSASDHGLTVGDGVFETMRVYGGTPFALTRHLDRLARSCEGLGLVVPDEVLVRGAVDEVIGANGVDDCRLRLTVTGGMAPMGSGRSHQQLTVIVAVAPLETYGTTATVIVAPWPRNEHGALVGLKTTSYGENVVALARARAEGADEAVFANLAGNLCEGTGTNVFLASDGRLITPPLRAGCLAGVTRALVMGTVDVAEHDVPVSALAEADEAFLTSSTREVQAIAVVDGRALPTAPGPCTTAAAEAYRALVARDLDP